jgi:hypothetical protein
VALHANGTYPQGWRANTTTDQVQLTFFEAEEHPVVQAMKGLDVETLTPLEALTTLAELQKLVKG